MRILKNTKHLYRGYTIHGGIYNSSGHWVLGGRYFKEGTQKRTYRIEKDGFFCIHPSSIIETLGYAKKEVDRLIEKNDK